LDANHFFLNGRPRLHLFLFLLFHVVILVVAVLALLPFHVFYIRFTQG
jgi:hypothetical protein